MTAPIIPLTPTIARLRTRDPGGSVSVEAVVGGGVCITWQTETETVDLYFGIAEAEEIAGELDDALVLARGFAKGDAGG